MASIQVDIVTPDGERFSGQASRLQAPAFHGSLEVLPQHAPLIALLNPGEVIVTKPDNTRESHAVNGGVLEVLKDKVVVLAD